MLISAFWPGCKTARPTLSSAEPAVEAPLVGSPFDPSAEHKYVLYPGDRLLVRYPTDPTLNAETLIRSDGKISLLYVGDVQAAQRSPTELAAELNQRYEGVLKEANTAVIVLEESGRRIYLGGQVRIPGAFPLRAGETLTQCIFEAGGITEYAQSSEIVVVRVRPGERTYVLTANLANILAGRTPDVQLEPFDIVYVPETSITVINRFVEQYINRMIPRSVSFPFTTELYTQPVRIISNDQSNLPPVEITR